jgi:hypothetical protein
MTAYFFPAFAAVLGTIWILVLAVGNERFVDRIEGLDSAEQAIAVGVILLATMMLAHMLSAMARPIATLFAGRVFPPPVRDVSIRGQLKARLRARKGLIAAGREDRLFPRDPDDTQPTSFGNVLAATADYPRVVYAMEAFLWWPRLQPLLPTEYQDLLSTKETPMRAMLNLCLVAIYLAFLAVVVLGLLGTQELNALLILAAGVVISHLCYRAAVTQATEFARAVWVAFDLYRSLILEQLHEERPATLEEERVLWQRLAERMQQMDEPTAAGTEGAAPVASAKA